MKKRKKKKVEIELQLFFCVEMATPYLGTYRSLSAINNNELAASSRPPQLAELYVEKIKNGNYRISVHDISTTRINKTLVRALNKSKLPLTYFTGSCDNRRRVCSF